MPKLSIIVPAYGDLEYLPQCVDSILRQTFTDFELIIVNDGSPNEWFDGYRGKDYRLRVLDQGHGGVTVARQTGVAASAGDYIGFVDSDDWVEPVMFERMMDAAERYSVDIVLCDWFRSSPRGERPVRGLVPPGRYDKRRLIEDIYPCMMFDPDGGFRRIPPALWAKLFRRPTLFEHLLSVPPEITVGEDVAVSYPCLLSAESIYVLDAACLYHYRQTGSSLMHRYKDNYLRQCLRICSHLREAVAGKGGYDLSPQIQANLCYFAVHSVFNETLRTRSFRSLLDHIRATAAHPEVAEAIRGCDFSRFYPFYRITASLIAKERFVTVLLLAAPYPLVAKLLGQVV